MGTRVDFYVGRGEDAEWLGSYPFDGYPYGVFGDAPEMFATPPPTEEEWRQWVARFLASEADRSTTPDMGWPWPWDDSSTTDYAYAWEDGVVYGANWGEVWFRVDPEDECWGEPSEDAMSSEACVFPKMRDENSPKATLGPRSGLLVFGIRGDDA